MFTFLQNAKAFTKAVASKRMADAIAFHFPYQCQRVFQLALELTSQTRELDMSLR